MDRGAAAALPRHGRLRAVPVQGSAARLQRGGREARRRISSSRTALVPWRAQEIYDQLRDAFKQLADARLRARQRQAVLVGAGALRRRLVPAAARLRQLRRPADTNQQGIHSRFETELFDRYQDKLKIAPAAGASPDAREFVFAPDRQLRDVEPILAADREAVQGAVLRRRYFAKMFEKTGPIMEKRISARSPAWRR